MRDTLTSRGLADFLFEIASDERIGILEAIAKQPLKHAAIARGQGMTGSETTRHLNRLVAAGLVAKNHRGEYELTGLAEVLRVGLPLFEFLTTHRDFMLTHRVGALEPAFVERLGELNRCRFVSGTYDVVAAQESALRSVHRRAWVVTEQRFEQAIPILREKSENGADIRVVRSRRLVEEERRGGRDVKRNFPVKVLDEVPVFLAVLDDQAGICVPNLEGKVDMATMMLVTDPVGCRWSEDLFVRLWDRADPWRIPFPD